MQQYVVGMGEALWDVLPEGKKIGGAPANFAYHASQFGLASCVVSAVGADANGNEILDVFASKGLTSRIAQVDFPTGTVQVTLDAYGVPNYEIKEGVAWDNIPFTPSLKQIAQQTQAVCFGSLAQRNEVSRATIHQFLDSMPQNDSCLKIFDINLRQHFYSQEVITHSLERCNILKINDEELVVVCDMFHMSHLTTEEQCRRLCREYGLRILILTCGTNGSYVFTPNEHSFLPTPLVTVADTVGAGDSFTGAFTAALLSGKGVVEAHELAVDTSAFVCTCSGAMPQLPMHLTSRLR